MIPAIVKNGRWLLIVISSCVFCVLVLFFFKREQDNRDRIACQNNLRKIGQAIGMYVTDNDGFLPNSSAWDKRAIPSMPAAGCPAAEPIPHLDPPLRDTERGLRGYAFNGVLINAYEDVNGRYVATGFTYASLPHPNTTIAVCDYTSGIPSIQMLDSFQGQSGGWPKQLAQGWKRHGGGGNYLFCDGHVKWFPESAILVTETDICEGDKSKPNFCVK